MDFEFQVRCDVGHCDLVIRLLLVFQRPLPNRRVNVSKTGDARVGSRTYPWVENIWDHNKGGNDCDDSGYTGNQPSPL